MQSGKSSARVTNALTIWKGPNALYSFTYNHRRVSVQISYVAFS